MCLLEVTGDVVVVDTEDVDVVAIIEGVVDTIEDVGVVDTFKVVDVEATTPNTVPTINPGLEPQTAKKQ